MEGLVHADETLDDLAGGRLKVLQKAKGYRFSLDALLLAHFVGLRPEDRVLELGTGSGVIALLLSGREKSVTITGIEIQAELVDMAQRSVAKNGLKGRVAIGQGDVREINKNFAARSFDVVVANPPYRKIDAGRINPLPEKAVARHELRGSIGDFLQAAAYVLKPAGRACLIYPATRLAELLCSLRAADIEPKRLRMVHSHAGGPGKFVLAEGVRAGGEELDILPPLMIYHEDGSYTEEMNDIFRELASPGSCAG